MIFGLALASLANVDLLGWAATTKVWVDPKQSLAPFAKSYAGLNGFASLIVTYLALLGVLSAASAALHGDVRRFAVTFTATFWLAYAAWILGSYAHFAVVTPADFNKFGISWSLHLTNEGGYIVALILGLVIANFFPRLAAWLSEAIRPELYIKIAIVILGGFIRDDSRRQAQSRLDRLPARNCCDRRGLSDLLGGGLLRRPQMVRLQPGVGGASRLGHFDLWCGPAIATGCAIRARPQVAVLVSSLVVVFALIEVLLLPFLARTFLAHEPLVAAAWMGLAVKTDGAAVAAGNITESLILAKSAAEGVVYQPGWILGTTTTIKVFVDLFIGIWAFILAHIWTTYINVTEQGSRGKLVEIYERFPKFIIGFIVTFVVGLGLAFWLGKGQSTQLTAAIGEANVFRVIFFILTFFSIGVLSNFRKLWQAGIGKLAAVYVVSLFGFIIWVGLIISWLFFHGIKPPLVS